MEQKPEEQVLLTRIDFIRKVLDPNFFTESLQAGFLRGVPQSCIRVLRYLLMKSFRDVTQYLVLKGYVITSAADQRFVETVFRFARLEFFYIPKISIDEFLNLGNAERKISFICDIMKLCQKKRSELLEYRGGGGDAASGYGNSSNNNNNNSGGKEEGGGAGAINQVRYAPVILGNKSAGHQSPSKLQHGGESVMKPNEYDSSKLDNIMSSPTKNVSPRPARVSLNSKAQGNVYSTEPWLVVVFSIKKRTETKR